MGSNAMPSMSKEGAKREDAWRAEDDHRTLTRAAEIRSDPGRMRGVAAHHRKTLHEIGEVGRELKRRSTRRAKRSMPSGR